MSTIAFTISDTYTHMFYHDAPNLEQHYATLLPDIACNHFKLMGVVLLY